MYSYKFSDLLEDLDWFLKQDKELGDSASDDKYRSLPHSKAKYFISEILYDLVRKAPERYERELVFKFYDSTLYLPITTSQYEYVDINSSLIDRLVFYLPQRVESLLAIYYNTQWYRLYGSSMANLSIYSPAHDQIYNANGWTDTLQLRTKSIWYPKKIMNNILSTDYSITALNADEYDFNVTNITNTTNAIMTFDRDMEEIVKSGDVVTVTGSTVATYNTEFTITSISGSNVTTSTSMLAADAFTGTATGTVSRMKIELDTDVSRIIKRGDTVTIASSDPVDYDGDHVVLKVSENGKTLHTETDSTGFGVYVADAVLTTDTDNQVVEVDDGFWRFFKLEIKRAVYARQGKAISAYEYAELKSKETEWMNKRSRTEKRQVVGFSGSGFGKKR